MSNCKHQRNEAMRFKQRAAMAYSTSTSDCCVQGKERSLAVVARARCCVENCHPICTHSCPGQSYNPYIHHLYNPYNACSFHFIFHDTNISPMYFNVQVKVSLPLQKPMRPAWSSTSAGLRLCLSNMPQCHLLLSPSVTERHMAMLKRDTLAHLWQS